MVGNTVIKTVHLVTGKQIEIHAFPREHEPKVRTIVYVGNRCVADMALTEQDILALLNQLKQTEGN